MLNVVSLAIAALIGYICGAIPFGFLYVKVTKKIDLREIGSGRTGGTNSFRAAGLKVGIVTSLSDVLKGFSGVWLTNFLFSNLLSEAWLPWVLVVAGVMTVVGHNWSIFLNWRGGAGTGPNVGWATFFWWPMLPIAGLVMAGMIWGIGMASVASLTMAAIIPIVFAVRYFLGFDPTPAYMVGGIVAALAVTWSLRPNIKRLLNGTERVVGPRAKRQQMKNAEG